MKSCWLFSALIIVALLSCKQDEKPANLCISNPDAKFTLLPESQTHIDFRNDLHYTEEFNTYTYRNFYNGAGVGIGDLNNDGLPDIFLCGNLVSNRLYINHGSFHFEDATDKANLSSLGVWSTGVSLADVNGDGWLDIYVCKSGKPDGPKRHNELFINQGIQDRNNPVPSFIESANEYGIADYGLSTHAAFFDYDKDGDLDLYLLNNSIRSVGGYDLRKNQRLQRDPNGGNKLYRNDNGKFTDVSESAGIYSSAIGYGLGVTIGDVNRDGWQDIFISNDFFEKDYLYMNRHDGTFTESLESMIGEISLGSMGADMADINNDGFPEIFVTEMLPENEGRLKTKTIFEDWDKYQSNVNAGYHRQFPRNVLQLNRGYSPSSGSDAVAFSEISRYSGVSATDWSWGALIFDMDNDGWKDIFVANGIFKDVTDLDYINFYADPITRRQLFEKRGKFLKDLIDSIPSRPISNYAFRNQGDLTFVNKASEWGMDCPSFSNGSAYGDLDNDGDLDLVVNNVNMPVSILRNNSEKGGNYYLTLQLRTASKNVNGLGAQVTLKSKGKMFYQELAPMRGYQSTVDSRLHFGVGTITSIDSIVIRWPDQLVQTLTHVPTNQIMTVTESKEAHPAREVKKVKSTRLFHDVSGEFDINFTSAKSGFIDFNRDPLLFHMVVSGAPKISKGDIDGDGRVDFFVGGGNGTSGRFYVQTRDGKFRYLPQEALEDDKLVEDTDSEFFDADNDGDLDLYVCSGGNEFPSSSTLLADRLYLNDGRGRFEKSRQKLPSVSNENVSTVEPCDFDGDGDIDLFVGVRAKPFLYGEPANGYLLVNDGKGRFRNVTRELAPQLLKIGMITDACWLDFDGDKDLDLSIAGDWMSIRLFENKNGKFSEVTGKAGLTNSDGFWSCLKAADIDQDGDMDLIAGNLGLNTRLKASALKPATMYVRDFDSNGKVEQIITTFNGDKAYPLIMRSDLMEQIPSLKKRYRKFSDYKEQTINDIFDPVLVQTALTLRCYTTQSTCFVNDNGKFIARPLPMEAQFAPVFAASILDYDGDAILDIFLGGNFYWAKPEVGIYDGSKGLLLHGRGDGTFTYVPSDRSGIFISGEIRDIEPIRVGKELAIIVSRYNDKPVILKKK